MQRNNRKLDRATSRVKKDQLKANWDSSNKQQEDQAKSTAAYQDHDHITRHTYSQQRCNLFHVLKIKNKSSTYLKTNQNNNKNVKWGSFVRSTKANNAEQDLFGKKTEVKRQEEWQNFISENHTKQQEVMWKSTGWKNNGNKIIHSDEHTSNKSHNWTTIFGTIWRLSGWSSKTAQGVK